MFFVPRCSSFLASKSFLFQYPKIFFDFSLSSPWFRAVSFLSFFIPLISPFAIAGDQGWSLFQVLGRVYYIFFPYISYVFPLCFSRCYSLFPIFPCARNTHELTRTSIQDTPRSFRDTGRHKSIQEHVVIFFERRKHLPMDRHKALLVSSLYVARSSTLESPSSLSSTAPSFPFLEDWRASRSSSIAASRSPCARSRRVSKRTLRASV